MRRKCWCFESSFYLMTLGSLNLTTNLSGFAIAIIIALTLAVYAIAFILSFIINYGMRAIQIKQNQEVKSKSH